MKNVATRAKQVRAPLDSRLRHRVKFRGRCIGFFRAVISPEPRNLLWDLIGADEIVGDVHTAGRHQHSPPYGHATRHREPKNLNAQLALRS